MLIYLMRCFLKDKFMKKIGISTARTTQPSAFIFVGICQGKNDFLRKISAIHSLNVTGY